MNDDEVFSDLRRAYVDKDLHSIFRLIGDEELRKLVLEDNIWKLWTVLERHTDSHLVKAIKRLSVETIEYDKDSLSRGQLLSKKWVIEELSEEEKQHILDSKAAAIRSERDRKLTETDWRVIVEVEKAAIDGLGIQYPTVWSDYRQALRDITKQPGFPLTVDWPVPPQ